MGTTIKKTSSYNSLLIIVILFLLLLVGYLTYSINELSEIQSSIINKSVSQYLTENPPADSLAFSSDNTTIFTHPKLKYTVNVPPYWKPQLYSSLAGFAQQPYSDLYLTNPEFEPELTKNVSLDQQKNASILIRVQETSYNNIEDKFNDNKAAQKIARNVNRTNLGREPAIQYDYSFQGENATIYMMIKNGFWYYIKFQYDNEEIKKKYFEDFQLFLNSLQTRSD